MLVGSQWSLYMQIETDYLEAAYVKFSGGTGRKSFSLVQRALTRIY